MAASSFKKMVIKVSAIGFGIFIVVMLFLYYANYSEGYRAGVPMKISHKGTIFKTYEGQLNIGGLTNNAEGVIPSTWEFSIHPKDKEVFEKIDEAIENNKRAKLYYQEKYAALFWRGDTKYFVTKVEILE